MTLLSLILTLALVGFLLWALNTYVPMDAKLKKILNAVVVICVVVWLLDQFGVLAHLHLGTIPRIR